MNAHQTEAQLLEDARNHAFRARMDKREAVGPIFAYGRGSVVRDMAGKEYLDFNSGQMCSALGHNHPRIVEAIKESCDTLIHAHSSHYNIHEIRLARRLGDIVPRPLQKSLFGESGADANEMAMLIARKYTGGYEIFSPHISFHGLSDSTRAVTFSGWHSKHGPLPAGHAAIVAPYCYRCPLNQTFPKCELACLKLSFELIDAQSTGQPAAVITEPLFSAGGVIEPPKGWLAKLKELCEARGMLLILDEEQTGLGKLGQMFAFESEGVVPDILTLAKHLGGGVAVSAVTTTVEIEEKVIAEGFVTTHSHSNDPLICAAGVASIDVVVDEDVPARARRIGERFKGHLHRMAQRYELIGDVRGRGMLLGIELVKDRSTRTPAFDEGREIAKRSFSAGLIFSVRRNGSVLRFVPPATTSDDQIDQAAEILDRIINDVVSQRS